VSTADLDLAKANGGTKPVSPSMTASARRARACRERERAKRDASVTQTPNTLPNVTAKVTGAALSVTNAEPNAANTVTSRGAMLLGAALALAGVALAAIGMSATISYSTKIAAGPDRLMLGGLAATADTLALLLPSAAAALWGSRRLLALAAVLLWLLTVTVTLSNLSGFLGVHADAFTSGRETAATERGLVLDRVARLRAERASIAERRSVGEITLAIRNAKRAHVDDERAALAIARHRDQLDADLAGLEHSIGTLPAATAADPAAAGIADIVYSITGRIVAEQALRRLRLALLLALPLAGGLVLAVGAAVAARRKGTE
jgi:hypothetical protein